MRVRNCPGGRRVRTVNNHFSLENSLFCFLFTKSTCNLLSKIKVVLLHFLELTNICHNPCILCEFSYRSSFSTCMVYKEALRTSRTLLPLATHTSSKSKSKEKDARASLVNLHKRADAQSKTLCRTIYTLGCCNPYELSRIYSDVVYVATGDSASREYITRLWEKNRDAFYRSTCIALGVDNFFSDTSCFL